MGVHIRESEEGCQVERPSKHQGFDVCFGTSAFTWARSDDVIDALKQFIQAKKLTRIYLGMPSSLLGELTGSLTASCTDSDGQR